MRWNIFSVIVAGAAHWIMGAVWYGLLNRPFAEAIGPDGLAQLAQRSEAVSFGFALFASLAIAALLFVMRRFGIAAGATSLWVPVVLAWTLSVAVQMPTVAFETRPVALFVIGSGYQLVAMTAAMISLRWVDRLPVTAHE